MKKLLSSVFFMNDLISGNWLCCAARSAFGRRAGRRGAPTGSESERSDAKWRGRGLGQRNTFFLINYNYLTFIILFFLRSNPIPIFLLDVVIDLEFNSRICTLFCINVIAKKHCNKQMPFWIKIRIY